MLELAPRKVQAKISDFGILGTYRGPIIQPHSAILAGG